MMDGISSGLFLLPTVAGSDDAMATPRFCPIQQLPPPSAALPPPLLSSLSAIKLRRAGLYPFLPDTPAPIPFIHSFRSPQPSAIRVGKAASVPRVTATAKQGAHLHNNNTILAPTKATETVSKEKQQGARMFADAGFGFSAYSPPGYSPAFTHPDFSSFSASPAGAAAAQTPPSPLPLLPAVATADDAIYAHLGDMGQPSLISEYDLGGEGDLFKAPEPIIDEPPLLSLDLDDPVAAAISMMSGGNDSLAMDDDAMKAGLSEVLYECEKELMEESAIEETISELLDVKIPMLQVEELPTDGAGDGVRAAAGECSLHKSVSSGCLNSTEWMNGASSVRPNFLDFGGLDFEAAFGLRRAYSEGDIQNLGANTPRPGNSGNVERLVTISDLKSEERKQKLSRYRKKKIKRNFGRKIKYACRKALADTQPRVRGRFAKMDDGDMLRPRK